MTRPPGRGLQSLLGALGLPETVRDQGGRGEGTSCMKAKTVTDFVCVRFLLGYYFFMCVFRWVTPGLAWM